MFAFHILVYIGFAVVMYRLADKSYLVNPFGKRWDKYLVGYILFYTIVCAIRWNVGVDSAAYAYLFEYGNEQPFDWVNGEVLFVCLENLCAKLDLHFVVGMGVCAFTQIFFLSKSLKEYKYILIALPIVLLGGRYFLDLNNGVRQMIVASIFVYASRFIVEKKIWQYLVTILICTTIHRSALVLLPFYLIPNKVTFANKRGLMFILFSLCFILGQTPAFQRFVGVIGSMSTFFGYERYVGTVENLLTLGRTSEALSFGPMMLSYLLSAYLVIWFGPYLKQRYERIIPYFNLWYTLSFFYACAYFLVCNISHLFIRPVQYFELFQLIIISLLLYDVGFSKVRNQLLKISLIVILWVNISWNIYKVSGQEWESAIYKVYFLCQDQKESFFRSFSYLK